MIKAGIITASDRASKGEREDQSGLLLKTLVEELPAEVIAYQVLPDEPEMLKKALCHIADKLHGHLILTTGGTGLGPRDCTPEATRSILEKEIPGIPEALRQMSLKKTRFAMFSRMAAGIRGKTLMINLPGSPEAVAESFEILRPVLYHALQLLQGTVTDCKEVREEEWKTHLHSISHSLHSHF
jgi:molybdenum cofactor synthesis domain-containing protein